MLGRLFGEMGEVRQLTGGADLFDRTGPRRARRAMSRRKSECERLERVQRMKRLLTLAITAGIAFPAATLAAGSAVVKIHGAQFGARSAASSEQSQVSWLDPDNVRMEMPGTDGYVLETDGKLYSVMNMGGQKRVLDMASMMQMAKAMAKSADTAGPGMGAIKQVSDTGKTRTVGGIEGHVYSVSVTDGKGATRESEMVLTDDPRVRDLTKAYLGMMAGMADSYSPGTNAGGWMAGLPDPYDGILAFGDQYEVVSISDKAPDAGRFKLPGKPMDLGGLMSKALSSH